MSEVVKEMVVVVPTVTGVMEENWRGGMPQNTTRLLPESEITKRPSGKMVIPDGVMN